MVRLDEVLPSEFTGPKQIEGSTENLAVGQMVLVGDAEDLCHRETYHLGRMHCLHPQTRKGKQIVCRAMVAALGKVSVAGSTQIDYVLRDLSKIAPI